MKVGLDETGAGAPDVPMPAPEMPAPGTKYYVPQGHGRIKNPAEEGGSRLLPYLNVWPGNMVSVADVQNPDFSKKGWVYIEVKSDEGKDKGTMYIHVKDLAALPLERRTGQPLMGDSPRALELWDISPLPGSINLRTSDTHEEVARIMHRACSFRFEGRHPSCPL